MLIAIWLFIIVGSPFMMIAELGSCQSSRISEGNQMLFPGDTMLLEVPYNARLFSVVNTNVEVYFYDYKPSLELISRTGHHEGTLYQNNKLGWGFHLNEGSAVKITWNSEFSQSIIFRVMKGKFAYDSFWYDDLVLNSSVIYTKTAAYGTYEFNASVVGDYYFTVENNASPNNVEFLFEMNEYEYKTTQGVRKVGNDYEIDIDPGYEYVVLKYSDNVTYGEEVSYYFASTYATDPYDDYRPVDDPFDGFPFGGVSLMYFVAVPLMIIGIVIFVIVLAAKNNVGRKLFQSTSTTLPITYNDAVGKPAQVPIDNQAVPNQPYSRAPPAVLSGSQVPQQAPQGMYKPQKEVIENCPFCGSTLDLATKNAYLAGNAICSYCKSPLN